MSSKGTQMAAGLLALTTSFFYLATSLIQKYARATLLTVMSKYIFFEETATTLCSYVPAQKDKAYRFWIFIFFSQAICLSWNIRQIGR